MNAQTAVLFLFSSVQSAAPQELVRLPKSALNPQMGFKEGGFGPMGKEANLAGWLVLNGVSFRNAEYPELARILRESYASTNGYVRPNPEMTPLANEQHESKATGEVVRGFAVCPSPAICGDLTGAVMPFNLDASL